MFQTKVVENIKHSFYVSNFFFVTRREIQTQTKLDLERMTTPDSRNTSSTTNLEEEEIADAPGNDGNASMPEQVKRPNPSMMMMMKMMTMMIKFFSPNIVPFMR